MYREYFCNEKAELKAQSEIIFVEISSGVYFIEKDRYGDFECDIQYTSSETVVSFLNTDGGLRVTVSGLDGTYSNFQLEKK